MDSTTKHSLFGAIDSEATKYDNKKNFIKYFKNTYAKKSLNPKNARSSYAE